MHKNTSRFAQRLVLAASLVFPANDLLAADMGSTEPPAKDRAATSQKAESNLLVFCGVTVSGGLHNYTEGMVFYTPALKKSIGSAIDFIMEEALPDGNKWVQGVVPTIEFKPLKGVFQGPDAGEEAVTIPGRGNRLIILDGETLEENRQKILLYLQEETRLLLLESEKPASKP